MASPSKFPILNPDTPLVFLPPDLGAQLEASRYLYVATLAAYIWDLLCSMGQDYQLVMQYPPNLPTVVYFASRVASLAYIVTSTIFQVAPVGSCQGLQVALGWCLAIAIPTTSLLFFLRLRAVFDGQRVVVAFFALVWLATLGGTITVPFAISGGHIADTDRCINNAVKPWASAGLIINACNDTLIFIAISWRITIRTTSEAKVKSFFGRRDMPRISRELLQGGQLYYMITVGMNILTIAMVLSPSIPPILHAMFSIPNMALENSMACRVFRNIKLRGAKADNPTTRVNDTAPSSVNFALRTFGGTEIRPTREPVQIRKTIEELEDEESMHVTVHDRLEGKSDAIRSGYGYA